MTSYSQTMNYNNENTNGQHQVNNNGGGQLEIKAKKLSSINDFNKRYRLVYLPIIQHILDNSNLETITIKTIRAELEDRLEFEFNGEEKDLIKQLIVLIFDEFVTKKQIEEAEDSDTEEETTKRKTTTKKKKSSKKKDDSKPKVKRTGGINVPLKLSSQMAEFTGVTQLSRPQVVKKIWEYIKEHDLQDPANRNNINNDSKLESLFGVKSMHSFGMAKLISPHVSKLEPHEIIKVEEDPQPEE